VTTHRKRTRQIIRSFEAKALKKRSLTVKVADYLTSYIGSVGFLLVNLILFVLWILINTNKIPGIPAFDPYPFVLLITAVSLEAIVLTTVVLMSQNKQGQTNMLRDELQLQVELITEREITMILKLLRELLKKKGYELDDEELEEMLRTVDTSYIERKLEEQLVVKQEPLAKKVTKPIVKVGKKVGEGLKNQN
jgi:uncharacterized membrane protein